MEFFLVQNLRTRSIKTVDYIRKEKPKQKTAINNVVSSI